MIGVHSTHTHTGVTKAFEETGKGLASVMRGVGQEMGRMLDDAIQDDAYTVYDAQVCACVCV